MTQQTFFILLWPPQTHTGIHVSQAQANKTVALLNAPREAGKIWFPAKLKWGTISSLCHQGPYKDLYTFHSPYTKRPPTAWLGEASEGGVPLPHGSLLLWSRCSSADSVVCELNTSPPPLPIHPHTTQCGIIDDDNNRISHIVTNHGSSRTLRRKVRGFRSRHSPFPLSAGVPSLAI